MYVAFSESLFELVVCAKRNVSPEFRWPLYFHRFNIFVRSLNLLPEYVGAATKNAEKFGFRPLTVNLFGKLYDGNLEACVYQLGMGDFTIESPQRVMQFLQMVKEGQESLGQKYRQIKSVFQP